MPRAWNHFTDEKIKAEGKAMHSCKVAWLRSSRVRTSALWFQIRCPGHYEQPWQGLALCLHLEQVRVAKSSLRFHTHADRHMGRSEETSAGDLHSRSH